MDLIHALSSGLTVGKVAGFISGGATIVSSLIPLLVAVNLMGIISRTEPNAATWSVLARIFQGGPLPMLLGTDSDRSSRPVSRTVIFYSAVLTGSAVLLFVAQFITPLPLEAEIRVRDKSSNATFTYVSDTTFFGKGTASRQPAMPFKRLCGDDIWTDCTPSKSLLDILSSGTIGTTVSGPLDILYRNLINSVMPNSTEHVAIGVFRPIESLLLASSFRLVEGLVVDTSQGGIGFRNQTVPADLELGATWEEDLLFVQPETVCTPNNFTLHTWLDANGMLVGEYFLPQAPGPNYLQDDGAFAKRNWTMPEPRWDKTAPGERYWKDSPPIPDLTQRSFFAAWWNNYLTAQALNLSEESHLSLGDKYTHNFTFFPSFQDPFSVTIANIDGSFFDAVVPYNEWKFLRLFVDRLVNVSGFVPGNAESRNFSAQFMQYGRRCAGFDDADPIDPAKPYIRCGNLYGIATSVEDPDALLLEVLSETQQQVYTCASATRATIKTVRFALNGTAALGNLTVISIRDKVYANSSQHPYWGVERPEPALNLNVSSVDLLWGLVHPDYRSNTNIHVRQAPDIYLPPLPFDRYLGSFRDNMAATTVFNAAWNSIYEFAAYIAGISVNPVPSYSGENQYALYLKWRELSSTDKGAASILNLIWTDLVASALVGTKHGFETGENAVRPVYEYHTGIVYTKLGYAVPAIALLAVLVALLVHLLVLLTRGRISRGIALHYLRQTSMGRSVLEARGGQDYAAVADAKTSKWMKEVGDKKLGIRQYRQRAPSGAVALPNGRDRNNSAAVTRQG